MEYVVCLLTVFLAVFCAFVGFFVGRLFLRKQTLNDIRELHTKLSGIENGERVGVVLPQEYRFRVCEIMKAYMKEHFPDELIDAIDDYVDARIYLENLED